VPGSEQNVIPRFASQWHIGKGAEEQPSMQYLVMTPEMEFLAEFKFMEPTGDEQQLRLIIDDKKTGQHLEHDMMIGKAYVFLDVPEDIKPYVETLDKTVLSVRDTIVESRYLVVGAEWGTTYIGKFSPKFKLTEYKDTEFEFGKLKTFKISYTVNEIENYFLVADNIPLPVRAQYYTIEGNQDYSYDLTKLEPPS
jgi:hypothetical protein